MDPRHKTAISIAMDALAHPAHKRACECSKTMEESYQIQVCSYYAYQVIAKGFKKKMCDKDPLSCHILSILHTCKLASIVQLCTKLHMHVIMSCLVWELPTRTGRSDRLITHNHIHCENQQRSDSISILCTFTHVY